MTKAIIPNFWIGAKFSDRCIHRFKPLALYLLLLFSITRWKKYRMREANLKSRLIDLPHDVKENILLRLPTKSIFCIICASKAFSSIIDSSLFASLHMSALLNNGMNSVAEVPQLMLFDRSMTKEYFEIQLQPLKYNGKSDLTKSDYNFPVSKILSKSIYNVDFIFHNLVFFKTESIFGGPSYLLNPFKREVLKIPTTETDRHLVDWYGMGFDSTINTCKIVHVYKDGKNDKLAAHVYVLRPRSCFWRDIQAVPPCDLSRVSVCAYGDMHWLVMKGSHRDIGGGRSHIISFDFKKEEFCWTPHPTLHEVCNNLLSLNDYYLLNVKGSMTIVDISSRKYVEIWVMKNYGKKEWSLDYKIDTQRFVERPMGMFEYYTCGEWEKGIFFLQENMGWGRYRPSVYYILDLQCTSMKRMEKLWSGFEKRIFSYTGSLISLKCYDDFVQVTTKSNVWYLT